MICIDNGIERFLHSVSPTRTWAFFSYLLFKTLLKYTLTDSVAYTINLPKILLSSC